MKNPVDRLFDLSLAMSVICNGTKDKAATAAIKLIRNEAWEIAQALDELQIHAIYKSEGVKSASKQV